jgi:predicted Na+-dependent transporter
MLGNTCITIGMGLSLTVEDFRRTASHPRLRWSCKATKP